MDILKKLQSVKYWLVLLVALLLNGCTTALVISTGTNSGNDIISAAMIDAEIAKAIVKTIANQLPSPQPEPPNLFNDQECITPEQKICSTVMGCYCGVNSL